MSIGSFSLGAQASGAVPRQARRVALAVLVLNSLGRLVTDPGLKRDLISRVRRRATDPGVRRVLMDRGK